MLEKQVTSWAKQRTVILYKFQLCLLANKGGGCKLSEVVDQMASLGDRRLCVMVASVKKLSIEQVAVKAHQLPPAHP